MAHPHVLCTDDMNFHISLDASPNPANFERHCHDGYELIYVTRGAGHYVVEGDRYPLKPNTLFLFRPKEYHCVEIDPKTPYERYVIHFEPSAVTEEARPSLVRLDRRNGGGSFYDQGKIPLLANTVFTLLKSIREVPREEGVLLTRLMLSEILVTLSVSSPTRPEDCEPLGLRTMRYLNEHLTERIVLEDLAQRFFVTRYYICRTFRTMHGVTIWQYLMEKRVYLARQLIETGRTATSAAMEAGFCDYSSFYRAHLRICGEPPTSKGARASSKTLEKKRKHK